MFQPTTYCSLPVVALSDAVHNKKMKKIMNKEKKLEQVFKFESITAFFVVKPLYSIFYGEEETRNNNNYNQIKCNLSLTFHSSPSGQVFFNRKFK
jgi:hypothetical protein